MSFDNGTYDELDGFWETVAIEPGAFTIALSVAPGQLAATLDILGSPHAFAATGTTAIAGTVTQLYVDRLSVVFDYAIMIETLP